VAFCSGRVRRPTAVCAVLGLFIGVVAVAGVNTASAAENAPPPGSPNKPVPPLRDTTPINGSVTYRGPDTGKLSSPARTHRVPPQGHRSFHARQGRKNVGGGNCFPGITTNDCQTYVLANHTGVSLHLVSTDNGSDPADWRRLGIGVLDAVHTYTITTDLTDTLRYAAAGSSNPLYVFDVNHFGDLDNSSCSSQDSLVVCLYTRAPDRSNDSTQFDLWSKAPVFSSPNQAAFPYGQTSTFTISTVKSPVAPVARLQPDFSKFPGWVTNYKDNGDGTATLSGSPPSDQAASYPVTITATNTFGVATQILSINVVPTAGFTSPDQVTFELGRPSSFTVRTIGFSTTPRLSASGFLPPGMTFVDNKDGTATIAGKPTEGAQGVAHLTATAGDVVRTQDLHITVESQPTFTSPDHAEFEAGTPASFTVTATGFPTPRISASVPAGMQLRDNGNGTATLSGTPNPPGTYHFNIAAANIAGAALQPFTMEVIPGGSPVTSPDHVTFTYGEPNKFTITTDHDHGDLTFGQCGGDWDKPLRDGLQFTDNGHFGPRADTATITWTPTIVGKYTLCVKVDQILPPAYWIQDLTITVTATLPGAPTILSAVGGDTVAQITFVPGPTGAFPNPVYTVTATDTTHPAQGGQTATGNASPINVGGLTNGDIYTFTVTAQTEAGTSPPSKPSASVTVGTPPTISGTPPAATLGVQYQFAFTLGGIPTPTVGLQAGFLPAGIRLSESGELSGAPTESGKFPVTLSAANGVGQAAILPVTVSVTGAAPGAPTIDSVTGGNGSLIVKVTPGPSGSSPITSYTATATDITDPGQAPLMATSPTTTIVFDDLTNGHGYTVTVTATSNAGTGPASAPSPPLTVGLPSTLAGNPPNGRVGNPYQFAFTVGGAPVPQVSLQSGDLPSGLQLSSAGQLTGTPSASGTYDFVLQASNGVGTAVLPVTIKIR